jgi:hypothetical protein
VDQVVREQQQYLGQTIAVRGYLLFGDDARNLWNDMDSYKHVKRGYVPPDDPAWKRCITVTGKGLGRERMKKLSGHYVTVKGVLQKHTLPPNVIAFGSCNDLWISMDYVAQD